MDTEPKPNADIEGLVGYSRDRSFYESRPGGRGFTKVHRESASAPEMAACDTKWILLNMDMSWDVDRLQSEDSGLLCRRCWPPHNRPGKPGGDDRG